MTVFPCSSLDTGGLAIVYEHEQEAKAEEVSLSQEGRGEEMNGLDKWVARTREWKTRSATEETGFKRCCKTSAKYAVETMLRHSSPREERSNLMKELLTPAAHQCK